MKTKEKVPSLFSLMNWLKPINKQGYKYINLSKNSCGPTENRTRDFRVSTKCFTIKLLAHNDNNKKLNYLNVVFKEKDKNLSNL